MMQQYGEYDGRFDKNFCKSRRARLEKSAVAACERLLILNPISFHIGVFFTYK